MLPVHRRPADPLTYDGAVTEPSGPTTTEPTRTREVLTWPNLVTVLRLAGIPVFLWLLFGVEDRLAAGFVLGLLGATDWVDGYLARRLNQVSTVGKILDPAADRLVLLVGIVALLVDGSVPAVVAVLALVREGTVAAFTLILGALGARRIDVTWWGKTGTFLMLFAFPLYLLGNADWPLDSLCEFSAWCLAVPGLAISYYAAAQYVPLAGAALREGRAARVASSP